MGSSVLVDTSVWVAFLRRGSSPPWRGALVALIEGDLAVVVDPVIAELHYGAKGEAEMAILRDLGASIRRAEIGFDDWVAAGRLGQEWRAQGRTLSLVDCLLAAVCERDGLLLWSLDADFDAMVEAGRLTRFSP